MNMTPKEKAKELVDKYQYAVRFDESETQYFANMHSVKECALIAVDEIIKSKPTYTSAIFQGSFLTSDNTDYWEEVKQEIQLL
jgi:hypothetical protein